MTWKRKKGQNSAPTANYRNNFIGLELACRKCEEKGSPVKISSKGEKGRRWHSVGRSGETQPYCLSSAEIL